MTESIKMRTMETAYQAIKEMDPDTAITRWAIRQAVSGGYIPSRRVGNKYLFNLDGGGEGCTKAGDIQLLPYLLRMMDQVQSGGLETGKAHIVGILTGLTPG